MPKSGPLRNLVCPSLAVLSIVVTVVVPAAARQPESISRTLAPVYGPLAEQIVSDFDLRDKQGTGIDLGSGPGDLILELCKRTRWMRWINADIDPAVFAGFLQRAEEGGFRQRVEATRADAHSLPFADASADIVVSRGSYPFWNDKHKAFGEVYRVLKPGGVAYIGRGFSANLPLEVARQVRERQRRSGKEPVYDIRQAEDELRRIMRSLEISAYRIAVPGRGDVNYGIWIEFRKPAEGKTAASLLEEPAREPAGLEPARTVVEKDAIAVQGAQSLVDALEFVPGAWIESRGRKVKQFLSFRGQKYPYPEYAIDGVLFREFHEVPYFISTGEVERVEVMRSGAAMLAGNSGMIGVIDVVPRQYEARQTSLRIEYGSLGTAHGRISHGGRAGAFSYSLGADGFRTEGPKSRHGEERMTNYHAGLSWKPSDSLSLSTHLFHIAGRRNMVQALPPATRKLQTAVEWFDPIQTSFGTLNALYRPNQRLSTQLLLGYSDRHNVARAQTGSATTFTRDWDRELTAGMTQSIALTARNVARVGANYNHWVAPYGKRFYTGRRCEMETYSLALADEQRFGSLVIDGALRYRRTYIDEYGAFNIAEDANPYRNVAAVANQWEPPAWSGSLGSAYYLSDRISLHGNLAVGTIEARQGTLTAAIEPPASERRLMADVGLRLSAPGIGVGTVSMFLVQRKDGINLSGEVRSVNGRLMELYENRDQDSKGLELDLRSRRFMSPIQFFFTSTVLTARIAGPAGMRKDREIPRAIFAGGLSASRWGCDLNLYWKSVSSYESLRFSEGAVYRPLGGFHNVDAVLARRFGLRKQTRIYVETKNLANRRYSTVVGYPDYGRRMTIGLDYTF